ncbi:hypothetical protein ACQKL0_18385 [Peribacillus sp. NPDC097264]|uniref:hypothetical protein n=1 Tax=Peribacillus sp. NPDC097264 TaxID=3390616 RepID=UPI003D069D8A
MLKFAYQDFLEDRQFKNTTEANIKNYKMLLGQFIDYCIKQEVVNLEGLTPMQVKSYLMMCQDKGNKAGTLNTKLLRRDYSIITWNRN